MARQGKNDEAVGEYRKALALNPRHADALYHLGWEMENRGRFAEAYAFYGTLLRESPDHADALRQRGMVAMKTGDPEKAAACFQAALRLRPGDSGLQEALSRVEKGSLQKKLDRKRH